SSPDELPEVAPRGRESRGTALFVDEEEEPAAAAAGDPMVAAGRRELQPHGTALFVDEEEALPDQQRPLAVEEAAAGAADDTMMAAVDDGPYLVEEPPEVVVPEKKRRKKSTVAKQGTVAEGPDIIFEKIIKAKRGQSIVMERVLVKEELFLKERRALAVEEEQDERDRFDDAFANEFSTASGDIERSLLIADQLTSGTLAIEDLSEEDRILAELFRYTVDLPCRTERRAVPSRLRDWTHLSEQHVPSFSPRHRIAGRRAGGREGRRPERRERGSPTSSTARATTPPPLRPRCGSDTRPTPMTMPTRKEPSGRCRASRCARSSRPRLARRASRARTKRPPCARHPVCPSERRYSTRGSRRCRRTTRRIR
ncbi:hypothetical protein PENTCL1PPCAC_10170, partial [Pristionchus entomophagus]